MQAPFLLAYSMGKTPKLTRDETGETILEIHPHGARNGWAMWPMNFDPVWITCRFPIGKEKEKEPEQPQKTSWLRDLLPF